MSEERKFELKLPYGEQQGTGQRRKKRKDSKSYSYLHSRARQACLERARQCCALSRAARICSGDASPAKTVMVSGEVVSTSITITPWRTREPQRLRKRIVFLQNRGMAHGVQRIYACGVSRSPDILCSQVSLDMPGVINPVVVCQVACCVFRFPDPDTVERRRQLHQRLRLLAQRADGDLQRGRGLVGHAFVQRHDDRV